MNNQTAIKMKNVLRDNAFEGVVIEDIDNDGIDTEVFVSDSSIVIFEEQDTHTSITNFPTNQQGIHRCIAHFDLMFDAPTDNYKNYPGHVKLVEMLESL